MNLLEKPETPPGVEFPGDMGDKQPEETSSLQPEEPMSTTAAAHTATNGKSEKKPHSQSEFIRSQPKDMPVEEVIRQGKLQGLTISRDRVNFVRRLLGKTKEPGEKKASPGDRLSAEELKARRMAAGQKAAATKAARKGKKRKAIRKDRAPKTEMSRAWVSKVHRSSRRASKPQIMAEVRFLECVVEVGFVRSQELLERLREAALKVV